MKPIFLGVAAIVATIGTAIATANHLFEGHLIWAFVCWGISLLLIAAAFVGWLREAPLPAQIKIFPLDLRRFDRSKTKGLHVFLRMRVELSGAMKAAIKGCTVRLSLDGLIETPKVNLHPSSTKLYPSSFTSSLPSQKLTVLPPKLRSGHPVEGWIHFETALNQYEIESCDLTVVLHTSRGDGSARVPTDSQYWNASNKNFLIGNG